MDHLNYTQYHTRSVTSRIIMSIGFLWTLLSISDLLVGSFFPTIAGLAIIAVGGMVQWYAREHLDDIYKDE